MKKMKKVMSLLLVMAMMTALVSGCANSGSSDAAGDTAAESTDARCRRLPFPEYAPSPARQNGSSRPPRIFLPPPAPVRPG